MAFRRGSAAARWTAIAVLTLVLAPVSTSCAGGSEGAGGAGGAGGGGGAGGHPEQRQQGPSQQGAPAQEAPQQPLPRLIGDGSTSYTGPQPGQPKAEPLPEGEEPPQFVVFSWDGAGEDDNRLFSRFRKLGEQYDADMTYFLSGLYLLPEAERERYRPPGRDPGASDIGYLTDDHILATLEQLRLAWLDGSEIATHFNGHFCGPEGVASWSPADWREEIEQAKWMVEHWRTTTGFEDLAPLPFDYEEELVGGRAPCLEGQDNLLRAAAELGFRYDSSGNGRQVWPEQRHGVWDIPLQSVPMPGESFETLSMDYNFMVNQSGTSSGDPAMYPVWEEQMREGLLTAFDRAYEGNRAPLIIGNHFNEWNGGIYMDAVADVIKELCPRQDVRCVSFRQLVDWLDAQDPRLLDRLRTLDVGERPPGGWQAFLGQTAGAAGTGGAGSGAGAGPGAEAAAAGARTRTRAAPGAGGR